MTGSSFDDFFAQAFEPNRRESRPYAYQRVIAVDRELPELVCIPTGCGKTATLVLGWLWRRFRHQITKVRTSTPRRLVYCVPVRTLVEQVRSNVIFWLKNLELLAGETARASWSRSV